MKKTIRLHHLLLKLALASILLSSLDSHAQAETWPFERSQTILISQTSAEDFAKQGASLFDQKRYQEALTSFDKAVQLKPDYAWAWVGRGSVLILLTRYQEALNSLDKATQLKPDFVEAWYFRGGLLAGLTRYQEAIASYDKAISLRPDYADAIKARQDAQKSLDDSAPTQTTKKPLPERSESTTQAQATAKNLITQGQTLYEKKRYEEALAFFDKAIQTDPDSFGCIALGLRGTVLIDLTRYQDVVGEHVTFSRDEG